MSALDDARVHLGKAREFLEAAELDHDRGLFYAATSNAVTSSINAKDAICLTLTGRTGKTDSHAQAIAELKATGMPGRSLAPTLDRLLRLKPKAQYQTESISAANAAKAKQSRPAGWVSDPHRVIQLLAAAVEEEWAVCVSVGGAEVIVLPYAVEDGRLSGDDPVTGQEIDLPVALLTGVRVLDDDEQYCALSGV